MTAGLDQLTRLAALPLEHFMDEAVAAHEDEITDLNRRQLDQGLDSEGNDLGVYKVFAYKNRFRPVDLKDTGAFRQSIYTDPFGTGFEVKARDSKTDELQSKYGDAILGLSEKDQQTTGEIILPNLIDSIRNEI